MAPLYKRWASLVGPVHLLSTVMFVYNSFTNSWNDDDNDDDDDDDVGSELTDFPSR